MQRRPRLLHHTQTSTHYTEEDTSVKHECKNEDVIEMIRENLAEIKGDVKSLLHFRTKIMAGAGLAGFLLSLAFSLFKGRI